MVVGRRAQREFPVVAVRTDGLPGTVTVQLGGREDNFNLSPSGPTLRDVRAVRSTNVTRLRVEFPDGKFAYVAQTRLGSGPSGLDDQLVLVPTAAPVVMPGTEGLDS